MHIYRTNNPRDPNRYTVFECCPDVLVINSAVPPSVVERIHRDKSRLTRAVITALKSRSRDPRRL